MGQEFLINEALINHHMDLVTPIDGPPLGLLLPPGSGRHSLPLIASGFSQIQGQEIDLFVLLTSHPENQTTIQHEGQMLSPLGSLEIDSQAADELRTLVPEIKTMKLSREQRAEPTASCFPVLPAFIKFLLPESKILPVLLAENQLEQAIAVGSALAGMLNGKRACVIAQTELGHGLHSAFEFNHPENFREIADQHGNESQVGAAPAATLLQYAQLSGGNTVSTLEAEGSGSVRSAAVMLWDYQPPLFNTKQQDELFRLALEAIESYITQGEVPEIKNADPVLERKASVFVTLRIRGMLRGCIGNMTAVRPLFQSVQDMAVAAATSDPRFSPLTTKELNQITIKVAILSPMQRMRPDQIEVGKHGVLITHYGKRGVLLPEVAADRGWSRETLLENVCQKAGLPGDAWQQGAKIYGFSSVVFGNG